MYSAASALAGAVMGLSLGFIGTFLPRDIRIGGATLLGMSAIVVATLEFSKWRLHPLQMDRETSRDWLRKGALRWAARNGWVLGTGVTTRIGFWLWFVVPFGALFVGDLALGMLVYGMYGTIRGLAVWVILGATRAWGGNVVAGWLLGRQKTARLGAASYLGVVGVAVVFTIGM